MAPELNRQNFFGRSNWALENQMGWLVPRLDAGRESFGTC
jgi:hypothetical protein